MDVIFPPAPSSEPQMLRVMHLTTGEDIMGYISPRIEEGGGAIGYMVTDPVTPHIQMDPSSGGMRIGLMPLRPYIEDKTVFIGAMHVVYVSEINEQLTNIYRQYHSNIVLPNSPSLADLLK